MKDWNRQQPTLLSLKGDDLFLHFLKTSKDASFVTDLIIMFMNARLDYELDRILVSKGYFNTAINCIDIGVERRIVFQSLLVVKQSTNSFPFFSLESNVINTFSIVELNDNLAASNCEGKVIEAIIDPKEGEEILEAAFQILKQCGSNQTPHFLPFSQLSFIFWTVLILSSSLDVFQCSPVFFVKTISEWRKQ